MRILLRAHKHVVAHTNTTIVIVYVIVVVVVTQVMHLITCFATWGHRESAVRVQEDARLALALRVNKNKPTTTTDGALCAKDHDDVNYSLVSLKRTLSDRGPLVTRGLDCMPVKQELTESANKCIFARWFDVVFPVLFASYISRTMIILSQRAFLKKKSIWKYVAYFHFTINQFLFHYLAGLKLLAQCIEYSIYIHFESHIFSVESQSKQQQKREAK